MPYCNHADPKTAYSACTHNDLRLRGGPNVREGRVEICLNNAWGTVCSTLFDDEDAAVVCAQMNFEREGEVTINSCRAIKILSYDRIACYPSCVSIIL